MASEIFVAQSDDKGGTWSGVIEGLRKNRPIYVRYPEKSEKNANLLLIQKGAMAISLEGQVLSLSPEEQKTPRQLQKEQLDSNIVTLLSSVDKLSAKDIISRLKLEWKDEKMKKYLEGIQQVEKIKVKNRIFFRLKGKSELVLFSD